MKRRLAWGLYHLVDPVNHFLVLNRDYPHSNDDEGKGWAWVQWIYDRSYQLCCWICAFDLEHDPEGWKIPPPDPLANSPLKANADRWYCSQCRRWYWDTGQGDHGHD